MVFQLELLKSMGINSTRTAIESKKDTLLYSDLTEISNKITAFLLKKGLNNQTIIGISLQDKLDQISAVIGIANARCVFVPLDFSIPEKRMTAMLKDLDLQYLICSKSNDDRYPALKKFFIEDILEEPTLFSYQLPDYDDEDDLYVYFTSGSTGNPKGVMGKNASLLQFIRWEIEAFNIDQDFRCSQFISSYFDAFLRDIFVPLLVGGTVCIPHQQEDFLSPEKVTEWLEVNRINLVHCVPSLFRTINNDLLDASSFPDLKYVLLSGEKIIPSELSPWYHLFGERIQLVNLYGATESTMIRAYYRIKAEDVKSARIPIGVPIADTELVILNKALKPCSLLVPGDLYIVSRYLTKGYLNNPELTAQRFVTLNLDGAGAVIAFKTGDKARKLGNGTIDLIGREDRQVKLRGIRIELDEVEYVLMQSGWIANAIVMKNGDEGGNESLIAFVTKRELTVETPVLISELQQHLANYLPEYMFPSRFIVMSEFPLLTNGKVDIKRLNEELIPQDMIAPGDEVEERLLVLWKDILGDRPISVEDSFQKMGGNSLSIMRLIGKISKEFGIKVSLSDLFEHLTIRKQAVLIHSSNKSNVFDIPRSMLKSAYHVSSAQERIYYNFELNKDRTSYNLPLAWEIKGVPDFDKIKSTFQALTERHEILRTEFKIENGALFQFVKDEIEFSLEFVENDGLSIQESIFKFIRPFDLNKAPLFRCGAIKLEDDRYLLVVDFHHIVCDGFSQLVLLSDFSGIYYGKELEPLTIQYKDYAEWEANFKTTREYIAHREFWLKNFDDEIPVLQLPTTSLSTEDLSDQGGNVIFEMEKSSLTPVFNCTDQENITVFSGLYALYFLFLCRLTGQEDITVGVAASGRMQDELQDLVGMFVKTLPIRYRLDPEISFSNLLKELHEFLIQANSKQVYDLSDILLELNNKRAIPIKSLFNVAFVFQNFEERERLKGKGEFVTYEFENSNSKYPLTLFISENDHSFVFRIEYANAYFSRADVEVLATQFRFLANEISENPQAKISDIIGGDVQKERITEKDITFNF